MEQISSSVESIVIQSDVGNSTPSFNLSNLPSLITVVIGNDAFKQCRSIVFESMNDWMNDEWDLIRLQSIILGYQILDGDLHTAESNELIMKNMIENDWLID